MGGNREKNCEKTERDTFQIHVKTFLSQRPQEEDEERKGGEE